MVGESVAVVEESVAVAVVEESNVSKVPSVIYAFARFSTLSKG